MNKYKQAVINGTTFESTKGNISLQDLYRIPLTGSFSLNAIGTALQQEIKLNAESLIVGGSTTEAVTKLAIIKDVIETRNRLAEEAAGSVVKAKRRRDITKALEVKRMGNIEAMSEAELEAELKAL